jgi:creatinine amidohydrolase
MFPDELEAAFAQKPLAWFAYGLCEPHGPQNALGLDALKAHALACAAAHEHGGIVAPPDYWHIHELGGYTDFCVKWIGEMRPWLTAAPPWVHFHNVLYHIRAADALGFRAAILITGHYGPNWKDLKTLIDFWQPQFAMRLFGLPDFEANFDGKGDHAGRIETSQLWHLEPDCVDVSRLPDPPVPLPNFATGPNAYEANRKDGEKMIAHQVAWLGKKAQGLLEAYREPAGGRRAMTFMQTEELWAKTLQEVFPKLETTKLIWEGREAPPESSRWFANWKFKVPHGPN